MDTDDAGTARKRRSNPRSAEDLRPSPLSGPRLEVGEHSALVRIRGSAAMIAWFSVLSAAERGAVLEAARAAAQGS